MSLFASTAAPNSCSTTLKRDKHFCSYFGSRMPLPGLSTEQTLTSSANQGDDFEAIASRIPSLATYGVFRETHEPVVL